MIPIDRLQTHDFPLSSVDSTWIRLSIDDDNNNNTSETKKTGKQEKKILLAAVDCEMVRFS